MPGPVMSPEEPARRRILVLDTGALVAGTESLFALRGLVNKDGSAVSPLGPGELPEFHVVQEVAQEVRDPRARARLQLIKDSVTVRTPSAESIDAVVKFSKATGDYPALSRVDIRVLALAWMVEKETNGPRFLRAQPAEPTFAASKTVSMQDVIAAEDAKAAELKEERERLEEENDGWVAVVKSKPPKPRGKGKGKGKAKKNRSTPVASAGGEPNASSGRATPKSEESAGSKPRTDEQSAPSDPVKSHGDAQLPPVSVDKPSPPADAAGVDSISLLAAEAELALTHDRDFADDETASGSISTLAIDNGEEFHDDGVGWINSENLEEQLAKDLGGGEEAPEVVRTTGCVTTDFAMQNVLIQMGLNLISVDGRRTIRRVRRYVLRCQSCTAVTRELDRKFCVKCGNATLTRVTYEVGADGVARLFLSSKFRPRLRGTKYPIPMPRGGRNNKDLILCEDQIDPHKLRRAEKQRERNIVDVLDPDTSYKVGGKYHPQRALVVGYGRKNPNEGKPSTKVSRR